MDDLNLNGLKPDKPISVAIDGPSGAGKSSVARAVAKSLGLVYVDTGAMYRAVALHCMNSGASLSDEGHIIGSLESIEIGIRFANGAQKIFLGAEDVTERIRTQAVADGSSKVAVVKAVRDRLVEIQRGIARGQSVIMDGRDIGTHVLPCADLKIYLDASVDVRARRRIGELASKGLSAPFELIRKEIIERDRRDTDREFSPLRKAADAVVIDTSRMTFNEVKAKICMLIKEKVNTISG